MKKLLLLLLVYSTSAFYLNANLDTIPNLKKSSQISKLLVRVHKNSSLAPPVLSRYSINDFTKSQVDSFLLALNDDKLINPYLILSAGLWQLDNEDVHQRLCSFISLDTLDYSGK